jgi:hypothetical protein
MNKVPVPKILVNTSSWINIFEVGLHYYLIENFDINTTPKVKKLKQGKDSPRMLKYLRIISIKSAFK